MRRRKLGKNLYRVQDLRGRVRGKVKGGQGKGGL